MADLSTNFIGIKSPNPFWLASAPPTDKEYNVVRAFKAGWGGVVWKTLGEDPAVVNVNGPRYGAIHGHDRNLIGFNNIELITDRPLEVNLREIKQVKRDWPDRAMVVSLMVPCEEQSWIDILKKVEDTGADGIELNFGCPHGMSERGMGSAVGQVPEYIEMVTRWCKQHSRMPVIVKLTPNITDIRKPAQAAKAGGADAVSLINTINSIVSVDLDQMAPEPTIDGRGAHGGYCGPAVKPIALNMVAEIARDPETHGIPISGIGGVTTWKDAAEFMALGAGTVQVCTAAMTYGFKIVEEMKDGLSDWMDDKGYTSVDEVVGRAVPNVTDWQKLNLNYVVKAHIDQDACIQCGRCHIACEDTSHQAITSMKDGLRHFEVIDEECVGCNLCVSVCPVENCISMVEMTEGTDPRTGRKIDRDYANWTTHPNNPNRVMEAAE
ncbi:NAD-dependent dihydropyrimidine dehydrogenase subunit PreA [Stappia sp. ES.058]|uniref:NAD-dependent dihydropyrimidine dehydrogenase subunit PreA n=1 Tax=Stappia sp. ES.058 TaxID=1881061 RepID=UPI00087CC9A1|nr:NAD-dependent dihydropyrimidine dehydrogenase subunit PreA [Stappia sp. ES.058]SDU44547.1 dihydroorotate oxidase B, catalytic subunit /dihydrouracil dehydrogenase (NAD+) /dihydropyrimidine dehydrogenase (NADP+) [Stappia sp. ES.058]